MPRPEAANEYERKLLQNIQVHGWQCTSVGAGDGEPSFSYTIGLFESFRHPELMVVGLSSAVAHGMLSVAAKAAREGRPLDLGQPTEMLLEGHSCVFARVPEAAYSQYVLSASWFYGHADFPLYQVVWPSRDGRLPWHPLATDEFLKAQPVVGVRDGGA